jgi:hypothetical protein
MAYGRCMQLIAMVLAAACVSAGPATRPGFVNIFAFMDGYRISHYLNVAVELQALDPDRRAARLRDLAVDPERASEAYVLCRMLFEAKGGGEFRRPMIGAATFMDYGTYTDWPLEPITIQDGVPILVVTKYSLGGQPESPVKYFRYCQANCKWRDIKYEKFDAARVKKVIEAYIAANPKLEDAGDWIRGQGE